MQGICPIQVLIIIFGLAVSIWGIADIGFDLSSMDKSMRLDLLHYVLLLASSFMLALYATVGYNKKGPIHLAGCAGVFLLSFLVYPLFGADMSITMLVLALLSAVSVIVFIAMLFFGDVEKINIVALSMVIIVTISSLCVIFIEDTPNEVLSILISIVPIVISVSLMMFYHFNSHTISG